MVGIFASIGTILAFLLELYSWLIIMRVLISWVSPDPYNPVVQFLYRATEPVMAPMRRILPPIAGLDLSPILALMLVMFLKQAVLVLFNPGSGGFLLLLVQIAAVFHIVLTFYFLLLLIRAGFHIYSWIKFRAGKPVRLNVYHPFNQFIFKVTEPAVAPLRPWTPTFFRLDVTPFLAAFIVACVLILLQIIIGNLSPATPMF